MSRPYLIWVVDDDAELRNLLREYLLQQQFSVRLLTSGRELERYLSRERPDLIVLDLMMPGENGLDICRRLRAADDDVPIIILSATSEPLDRVLGIESGADDYIAKPFLPRELTARIQAVLRRRNIAPTGAPIAGGNSITFGVCKLDLSSRILWQNGVEVEISNGEFSLLSTLARYARKPLSRARLIELVGGPGSDTKERSVDVQIARLRKLVELDQIKPRYIQTIWGFGYIFVPDDHQDST